VRVRPSISGAEYEAGAAARPSLLLDRADELGSDPLPAMRRSDHHRREHASDLVVFDERQDVETRETRDLPVHLRDKETGVASPAIRSSRRSTRDASAG
jgi:hypothetical protein